MRSNVLVLTLAATVLAGLSTQSLSASEISFSFGASLAPSETAGAPGVNAANWNAFTNSSGAATVTNPLESTGATALGTSATFTASAFGTSGGSGLNDTHLFTGWVDQSDNGTPSTLVVSHVPYANYEVLVYMHNDTDGINRTGEFTVNGSTQYLRGPGQADLSFKDPGQGGSYVLNGAPTQSSAAGTPAGDYVLFQHLSGSTLTIDFNVGLTGDSGGCCARDKFVGVQIVQTAPEPSTLILCGLGALGLLIAARRRRKA